MLEKVIRHYREGTLWGIIKNNGPFRMKPIERTSPYTTSHLHKGRGYHQRFDELPGRKLIWGLEQEVLHNLIQEKGRFVQHLDFAGGTGRIAGVLEDYCDSQYVLDVSDEMLAVARENLHKAEIICRDFNEGVPELGEGEFDLVTAFRFFPNAEPTLRESAMRFIVRKLSKGGWLVCNNHRNFWSVPFFTKRLTYSGGLEGMSNSEMTTLASQYGLSLMRTYSMGVLPQGETKAPLPWGMIKRFECSVFRWGSNRHRLGYNVVFVFERK